MLSDLREKYHFEVFAPIGSHANQNEKKINMKNCQFKMSKIEKKKKTTLVRTTERKIREKFKSDLREEYPFHFFFGSDRSRVVGNEKQVMRNLKMHLL